MKSARRLSCLFLLAWLCLGRVTAQETDITWEIEHQRKESQIELDQKTRITTAINGATIKFRDPAKHREAVLTAERMTLNEATGDVVAEGQVFLQSDAQTWRGERLEYNFKTGKLGGSDFRTGKTPLFAAGTGLLADPTNNTYTITNAFVTGDDIAEPSYRIRARSLKLVPGKYLEARDATLYLGHVPVMYLPYFHREFGRHPNNFEFTPGYRSLYGAYLLGTYNWFWSSNLMGSVHLDYRQKRGVAGGPDLTYDLGRWGKGQLQTYYANDDDPGLDVLNNQPIRTDRYRLSFSHSATLRTNLTAKVVVRGQSDTQVIRDFFEQEYRLNGKPASYLELNQAWSNYTLDVLAQPRLNDFFETVERLPDIKLTGVRQQLGVSPFYYDSESSAGYFRHRYPDGIADDFAASRADTYHQITLPRTFFGWLNFTPRAGGRFTYYSETEGQNTTFTEETRGVFNTGAELSFKASRIWRNARNKAFDVTELRHIIEPSINYVYVPEPNVRPNQLPQFDTELPTLRLLPIEYPDYNSIDSIDSQNVLRFGLRNKLQTKRGESVDNLVNWALYTDWRLKPRPGQTTFPDLYSDLDFKPRSWLTLSSELRHNINGGDWREVNHTATLIPNSTWSWAIGHRYLKDAPALYGIGNNLIISRFYYRLNENWAVRASHHFEARDGTMEEQYYTIYRDLRSWTAGLTFRLRDSRGVRPDDFTVALTFSLKAFPRYKLGRDSDQPSYLLGGG
jgi:lipopolysaccharide assembly outer membrane protein LptD (OstA)